MDASAFVAGLVRPLFWLITLPVVYWLVSFLPEKIRKFLMFKLF